MIPLYILLEDVLNRRLELYCEKYKLTKANIVRNAINKWLEENKVEKEE